MHEQRRKPRVYWIQNHAFPNLLSTPLIHPCKVKFHTACMQHHSFDPPTQSKVWIIQHSCHSFSMCSTTPLIHPCSMAAIPLKPAFDPSSTSCMHHCSIILCGVSLQIASLFPFLKIATRDPNLLFLFAVLLFLSWHFQNLLLVYPSLPILIIYTT